MYGTEKSTGPFRMTLQVRNEPRCPGCAEFLQPCVVEFRDGWAWCALCVQLSIHSQPWVESVLGSVAILDCSVQVNGLRFYTPEVVNNDALTAYVWCAVNLPAMKVSVTAPQPDGVYAITPAGEQALTDRRDDSNERWESQCLQQRKAICDRGMSPD